MFLTVDMPLENSLGIYIGKDGIVDTELMLDPKRQYFIYRLGEAQDKNQ